MAILKDKICISISGEKELSQLEKAFQAAGYKWYIPGSRERALENKMAALLDDGIVCGNRFGCGKPCSFSEGMALLGAPVEEKAKTFKVGDRVRIVRRAEAETLLWNSEMRAAISKCGIVTGVGWCGKNFIRVKTENCEYYYLPESLELVTEPEAEKPVAESPRMEWRDARLEDIGKGLKCRAREYQESAWRGEDATWNRVGVNERGGWTVHGVTWKYVQVLAPVEVTEAENEYKQYGKVFTVPGPEAESLRPMPGRELEVKIPLPKRMSVEATAGSTITGTSIPGIYSIDVESIEADTTPITSHPFPLYKDFQMSETKTTPTTIERRIALAAGRILWRAAWPVRKLAGGVVKGAVNMFYAALFGGVCYGGYELIQFLQAVKITWPE